MAEGSDRVTFNISNERPYFNASKGNNRTGFGQFHGEKALRDCSLLPSIDEEGITVYVR